MRISGAVAVAVAGIALVAGCGARSDPASVAVSEACGADERDDHSGDKAPNVHLTGDEIERAEAQGKKYGEEPGLYVTIVETIMQMHGVPADDAMHRAEIQYLAHDVESGARTAAGKYWGGAWFDHDSGGRFTVAVARGGEPVAVEAVFAKQGMSDDTAVVTVDSTYVELERAEARIESIVFENPGGRELGIDPVGNCVVATVAKAFPDEQVEAIEAVGTELGVAVLVDRIDEAAGQPNETGVVTEIDAEGSVLEHPAGEECGIWVSSSEETEVVRESGDAASWSDIAVGDTIDVWFSGAIAASCPGLGAAAKVLIRD